MKRRIDSNLDLFEALTDAIEALDTHPKNTSGRNGWFKDPISVSHGSQGGWRGDVMGMPQVTPADHPPGPAKLGTEQNDESKCEAAAAAAAWHLAKSSTRIAVSAIRHRVSGSSRSTSILNPCVYLNAGPIRSGDLSCVLIGVELKVFGEALGLLVIIAALIWGSVIYIAEPVKKPIIACKPLYLFSAGARTTGAAAASANELSRAPTAAHVATAKDANTGTIMALADRLTLGCLRFTDRLFNRGEK